MTVLKFEQPELPIIGAGPRLLAAREALGLSRGQLSERTKIPERMLATIEAGDFAALPAKTYATGFTRTYARAVGLNAEEMVAEVRRELGEDRSAEPRPSAAFEPGDPARVPSPKFAWLSALAALVVLLAGAVLWKSYYAPAVTLPPIVDEPSAAAVAPDGQTMALPPAGAVDPALAPSAAVPGAVAPTGAAIDLPPAPRPTMAAPRRAGSAPAAVSPSPSASASASPSAEPPAPAVPAPVAASTVSP